nr:MAG TPA: hypothetical protein [Caudoviricetes sp.]
MALLAFLLSDIHDKSVDGSSPLHILDSHHSQYFIGIRHITKPY